MKQFRYNLFSCLLVITLVLLTFVAKRSMMTPEQQIKDSIVKEGEMDYKNGVPSQANPYIARNYEYMNLWLKGWNNVQSGNSNADN
jgi:hypothetical protein